MRLFRKGAREKHKLTLLAYHVKCLDTYILPWLSNVWLRAFSFKHNALDTLNVYFFFNLHSCTNTKGISWTNSHSITTSFIKKDCTSWYLRVVVSINVSMLFFNWFNDQWLIFYTYQSRRSRFVFYRHGSRSKRFYVK